MANPGPKALPRCPQTNCRPGNDVRMSPRPIRYGDQITLTTDTDWAGDGLVYGIEKSGSWRTPTTPLRPNAGQQFQIPCAPQVANNRGSNPAYAQWKIVPYRPEDLGKPVKWDDTHHSFVLEYVTDTGSGCNDAPNNTLDWTVAWPWAWANKADAPFQEATARKAYAYFYLPDSMTNQEAQVSAVSDPNQPAWNASGVVFYGATVGIAAADYLRGFFIQKKNTPGYGFEVIPFSPDKAQWQVWNWMEQSWFPDYHDATKPPYKHEFGQQYFTTRFRIFPAMSMSVADCGLPETCDCACYGDEADFGPQWCPQTGDFAPCVKLGAGAGAKYRFQSCENVPLCSGKQGPNVCAHDHPPQDTPGDTKYCCDPKTGDWKCRSPGAPPGQACVAPPVPQSQQPQPPCDAGLWECTSTGWTCKSHGGGDGALVPYCLQ